MAKAETTAITTGGRLSLTKAANVASSKTSPMWAEYSVSMEISALWNCRPHGPAAIPAYTAAAQSHLEQIDLPPTETEIPDFVAERVARLVFVPCFAPTLSLIHI